jgi:hypothetical protein
MATPSRSGSNAEDCSTTNSFSDHGIADGVDLVTRTHQRLATAEPVSYSATEEFFDRLEEAFYWAYLGSVEERTVPGHVEAAVDDAIAMTAEEFEGESEADLRTEVVPTFFQYVAGFHCSYREHAAPDFEGSTQQ